MSVNGAFVIWQSWRFGLNPTSNPLERHTQVFPDLMILLTGRHHLYVPAKTLTNFCWWNSMYFVIHSSIVTVWNGSGTRTTTDYIKWFLEFYFLTYYICSKWLLKHVIRLKKICRTVLWSSTPELFFISFPFRLFWCTEKEAPWHKLS